MNSSMHGIPTSAVEVTHISSHGIWLLANGRELFLPYEDFPWFKDAAVREILNVEQLSTGHFFWPDLDVDLSENSIEHPEKYPMRAR
ncbi:MAG: DUF2442 domain-containing protein [Gammaproteobacteria bacterium]|nr:DUF2442 domain-containing protein [Gammaproteobacteria bacterium]